MKNNRIRSVTVGENFAYYNSSVWDIKEFHVNGEMALITWYRATNKKNPDIFHEINSKSVSIVEYESINDEPTTKQ